MDPTMGSMGSEQDRLLFEYLMEMGALAPEQANIGRQRAMVEQLRGAAQVPTDVRQSGRVATARHPLEMLAPAIGQGIASYRERGINTAEDALKKQRTSTLARLFGRGGGTATQTPGPMAGGYGLPGQTEGLF